MKNLLLILFFIGFIQLEAQKWIDTSYTFNKTTVTYGNAIDFAGNNRTLTMDICVPGNDVPPTCGRPLFIAIHGGSFMAGSKDDISIQKWMKDYAKRGYVTASINYRLGMFQTSNAAHCNVSQMFNTPWDCSNMSDTAEWYRGCYRGIQDAKGAIRYLILHKSQYKIDPRNVFIAGESAGGFIALGAAFLDTAIDKHSSCGGLSSVAAPNAIYESACIQQFSWDTSIASMQLARPDLGSIHGTLNDSADKYVIKGIGNFYGGMFPAWLDNSSYISPPAIYIYHQPNDLIVPYKTNRVMRGYSDCFTNLGCAQLINTPWILGSAGIRNRIESLKAQSKPMPAYWFDSTTNNADCAAQAFNPALAGHATDNYWLRSLHMAQYFAPLVDTSNNCHSSAYNQPRINSTITVSPNPFLNTINIKSPVTIIHNIQLFDMAGREIKVNIEINNNQYTLIPERELSKGIYFIGIRSSAGVVMKKVVKA